MRQTFIRTLVELAETDPRIVLLTGDLGFMVLEPFMERFPKRFFNTGVAEQNMVGMATGLAEAGLIPFVYSITTFASLRPYEFIRNGPVLHHLPVRIVGVGEGFGYGSAGITHHGLEEVSVLRAQPGLYIVAPSDYQQMATALRQTWDNPNPIYYRIGKDEKYTVPNLEGKFELGKLQLLREGADVLILVIGSIAQEAEKASVLLAEAGIRASLGIISSVSPAPIDELKALLARYKQVFTVEEHYITGGIGSLVAEVIAENNLGVRLTRLGVRDIKAHRTGSTKYLYSVHGLTAQQIANTIKEAQNYA